MPPISFNTADIPDSATIILTTFYITQHNGSSLYVDNLSFDTPITSVKESISGDLLNSFALMQNYPNPFNSTTEISFDILQQSYVSLKIYDLSGREVTTLVNENLIGGSYKTIFNADDIPSGMYIYRLQVGEFQEERKLLILR